MANSSSCVAFREYYCLVPSRVLWSFLCFLSQKNKESSPLLFQEKQRNKSQTHLEYYIYICLASLRSFILPMNILSFPNMVFSQNLLLIITASVAALVGVAAACSNGECRVCYSLIFLLGLLFFFFLVFNLTFVLMFSCMMNVHRMKIVKLDSIASLAR